MRKKKDSVNVSMRIDKAIWDALKDYADAMGQNYTVATERILMAFLKEQKVKDSTEGIHVP